MILEVSWDGIWTLSFGLSQFHGHGSWHVCEVALKSGGRVAYMESHRVGISDHLTEGQSTLPTHFQFQVPVF
jgi:hypothetical protein